MRRHGRAAVRGGALGALIVALAMPGAGAAQPRYGQPIYPAYQGFVQNPDGSVTMVFQYFSHGRDPVTVPVGSRNRFTGESDRNQPTTFLPGNHEFVCVLVVEDREAAKALRWTIAFPDDPSETSLDPLNPEYMLTEQGQEEAHRALDPATAPRGVCLNKPPKVRTRPRALGAAAERVASPLEATVGEPLALAGSAEDEGLPRGSALAVTWRQTSGPGTAVFTEPGSAATTVTFDAAGSYELELLASDGELEASERVEVVVAGG
ncbi:MAG TPA: hypothetical protein VMV46_14365 [Thermoanaerobaculia bacterium]|nr:hypothetical protein [Thermoanaerobaculia bacterium]